MKKITHPTLTGVLDQKPPQLYLLILFSILSLLALWFWFVPVTLAFGQAQEEVGQCGPAYDPPDFSISASPALQTVIQGEATTYVVTLNTLNCYTGTVTLAVTGLPENTTFSFDPAAPTPPADSTLSIITSADTPAGTYALTISGDSGTLYHETSVELVVNGVTPPNPDFTIAASPASQEVEPGVEAVYTVSLDVLGGSLALPFSGTVALDVSGLPAGASATFNPDALTPPGDSSLTIVTSGDTPKGTYPLTISGDSGSRQHEVGVALIVNGQASDFTIAASPDNQSVEPGGEAAYTVSLDVPGGSLALPFSGTVALDVSGLPAGASATFNPDALTPPGDSSLTIVTSGDTPAGTYPLTISGDSGDRQHEVGVTLIVNGSESDFTIVASPASRSVERGGETVYTVSLDVPGGSLALPFSGTVALDVSGLPTGASATFSPDALTPPGDSTLTVVTSGDTPTGTYPLTISGDSGDRQHETTVALIVNGNSKAVVSVYPASNSIRVGDTVESQILLSNAQDFYGAEFFMTFDPSVLQVVDANPTEDGVQIALGDLYPTGQSFQGVNQVFNATGQITFVVTRHLPAAPVDGEGVLAIITWEAINEGSSDLSFTHVKLATPAGFELEAISQDGSMNVTRTGVLSGTVHPQGRMDYSGVEVSVSPGGLKALTDILGRFSFFTHGTLTVVARMHGYLDAQATVEVAPDESVDLGTTTLYGGEVTGDNLINIQDLSYMGARFHTDDLSADINGDTWVDILDLVLAAANFLKSGPTTWGE